MATYVPNATNAAEPTIGREVRTAAEEFRTLKADKNSKDARLVIAEADIDSLDTRVDAAELQLAAIALGTDSTALAAALASHAAGQGASLIAVGAVGTVADQLYGRVSVMSHGADPTGVTANFHTVIDAAVAALPSAGGIVDIPTGVYLAGAKITDSGKSVHFIGHGFSALDNTNGATTVKKGAGVAGNGWELTNASSVRNLTFLGVAGNTGDGLVLLGGRCGFVDFMVTRMGGCGVRIGKDAAGGNSNLWYGRNFYSKGNGLDGIMLSDKLATAPNAADCNGGSLFGADIQINGRHGVFLENSQLNTFVGVATQTNGVDGVHFAPTARFNQYYGGDTEGNVGKNIVTEFGSTQNHIVAVTTQAADCTLNGATNFVQLANYTNYPFGVTSAIANGTTPYPLVAENPTNTNNGRGVGLLLRPPNGSATARDGAQIASEQEATNKDYIRFSANNSGVLTEYLRISPNFATVQPGADGAYSLGRAALRWSNVVAVNATLTPPASVTPANNGEVMFQLTSNTSLTFKVKGSDGTVRSGSIVLA